MHKPTISSIISDIRNAAYMSAFITFLLILIEVPIVIIYIMTKYIVTFLLSITLLMLWRLITMMWDKATSTPKEPSDAAHS